MCDKEECRLKTNYVISLVFYAFNHIVISLYVLVVTVVCCFCVCFLFGWLVIVVWVFLLLFFCCCFFFGGGGVRFLFCIVFCFVGFLFK